MIFFVLWHMLPWWSWLVLALAIAAVIFVPGLAPIVIGLARRVPLAAWAFVGVVLGSYFLLEWHDEQLVKDTTDAVTLERNTYWKGRETAANNAYADNLAALNRKLEHAAENAAAAKVKHAAELAANDARHRAQFEALRNERSENVTPEAIAACDLRRGVIVQFNSGAARANGSAGAEDPAAAAARRAAANEPSGVALDTYAAAVDATQDVVGDLRNQVTGWQKYHAEVLTPWITSTLDALSTCIPKGSPQ